ncbi:MAG: HEAT repeat domain-containing protein [Planctomycetes bacterium]|nr:HEAT repeat domain-containing protein [Planctomycetota bacterium]
MRPVACPKCSARLKVGNELLKDATLKCPRCGNSFAPGDLATPAPSPADGRNRTAKMTTSVEKQPPLELDDCEAEDIPPRSSRGLLLGLVAGVVLLVGGGLAAMLFTGSSKPKEAKEPKPVETPVAVVTPTPTPPPPKESVRPFVPEKPKPAGDGEKLTANELIVSFNGSRADALTRYNGATLTVTGKLFYPARREPDGEVIVRLSGNQLVEPCVVCRFAPGPDSVVSRFPTGAELAVRGRCTGWRAFGDAGGSVQVELVDCSQVGESSIPIPKGTDHPKAITHLGIEIRVAAVRIGHPLLVLDGGGPNIGTTVPTKEKLLVFYLEVSNRRTPGLQTVYTYGHPVGSQLALLDEKGNRFAFKGSNAAPEADPVFLKEWAANPKRRLRYKDESTQLTLVPGESATYLYVFDAGHLGKGERLFLKLPDGLFGLRGEPEQVFRFDQKVVERLLDVAPEPTPVNRVPPPDPELDAKVAALAMQLGKGKTPADRTKAANEILALGPKAKAATSALCQAIFDSAPQVRVTALDAMKVVNPEVYGPVAKLTTPLMDTDFLFMGASGRPEAVAALAKLGSKEGRPAVPILIAYKKLISRPGGWPHVPAVVETLADLAPDDPAVIAMLCGGLLKDGYTEARESAAKSLLKTKATKESVAALATAVRSDPEADVRLEAVKTLAGMGADAKAALKNLEKATTDPDARVREAARDAVEKVK